MRKNIFLRQLIIVVISLFFLNVPLQFPIVPQLSANLNTAEAAPPLTDYYLIAVGTTAGDTIAVNDDTDYGTNVCTLRDALDIVNGSTISGPVGGCDITLIGSVPANLTYVINLPTGGYTYTTTEAFSGGNGELDINLNEVYIVGDTPANTIVQAFAAPAVANRSQRVFHLSFATVEFSNMTIRHGTFSQPFLGDGAGINVNASNLTLDNVIVSDNYARGDGAGIYFQGNNVTPSSLNIINGSQIIDNVAGQSNFSLDNGGGIYARASIVSAEVNITDSEVSGNVSITDGGGINTQGSLLTINITNSVIDGNTTGTVIEAGYGAGLHNSGATVNIRNSTFTNNAVLGNATNSGGGAIYNTSNGIVNILESTQVGTNGNPNTARNGGGIYNDGNIISVSQLIVDNASVQYNTATAAGGGIYNEGYTEIRNGAIIDNNQASGGGGIGNNSTSATLLINDSFITNNQSTAGFIGGGGLANMLGAQATINNTLFDGNTSSRGAGFTNTATNATLICNNCTFTNNSTTIGTGGAFVNLLTGQVTLNNSIVGENGSPNSAGFFGGAIGNLDDGSQVTLNNTSVEFNITTASGGGIYNSGDATMLIQQGSSISNNIAATDGGGIYVASGTVTINNTVLDNNRTNSGSGGGIAASVFGIDESSTVNVNNSQITNNIAAADGGGVIVEVFGIDSQSAFNANNVTISGNTATNNGGGVYVEAFSFGSPALATITNSRIENNSATNGGGIHHNSGTTRVNRTCIVGNGEGFRNEPTQTTPATQDATNNWWGAADGPNDADGLSGATGGGDGVTELVNYTGYFNGGCLFNNPPANVNIEKIGVLGAGQVGLDGDTVTWTLTVTNNETGTYQFITVSDTLPDYLSIDSVSTSLGTVSISGQTVMVDIFELISGQSATIEIISTVVTSPPDGTIRNVALVEGDGIYDVATAEVLSATSLPQTGYPPRD